MPESKTNEEIIPESLRLAATEIAAVCKKYGMRYCNAKLLPGYVEGFDGNELELVWRAGRHNVAIGSAVLLFQRKIVVDVETDQPSPSKGE